MRFFVQLVLIISYLSNLAFCLYEDQVQIYDWRHQYIGRPTFSRIDGTKNKIFLTTDHNVICALNLKTGNIIWRKVLESSPNGQINNVIWGAKEAILVTSNGQRIQSFNYNHGFSSWEYMLFNRNYTNNIRITGIESKQDSRSFYVTDGFQLCYVNSKDKTCVDFPSKLSQDFIFMDLFETENGIHIIGITDKNFLKLHYNLQLSSLIASSEQNSPSAINSCGKNKDLKKILCYSTQDKKIFSIDANTAQITNYQLANLKDESEQLSTLNWFSNDIVLLESAKLSKTDLSTFTLALYKLPNENGVAERVQLLKDILHYDIGNINNENYLVVASYTADKMLNFQIFDLKNGQERKELAVHANDANKKDLLSILEMKVSITEGKSNGRLNVNVMAFFEDYSLTVFNSQGASYFVREEALAYISNVEMVDLPLSNMQKEIEDEFSLSQTSSFQMFHKRIRSQFSHIYQMSLDLFHKLTSTINNLSSNRRSQATTKSNLNDESSHNEFNLNKIIVAVTSVGKVFGIYSGDSGRIEWSFFLKNTSPFFLNKQNDKSEASNPLFLQRTTAHFPYEPQCALITKLKSCQHQNSCKSFVYFFNPLTGEQLKTTSGDIRSVLDYQIKQAFLLNTVDAHFLKPLVILNNKNQLHVFPEYDYNLANTSKKLGVIYVANTENDKANSLVGYSLKFTDKPLSELWRITFDDEIINAIGSKLINDRIHTHGKVLGDRSVLYKYLNPNLIGVVTSSQDSQKVPYINVYLVDTVTGSIVKSFNHKRSRGPVHIIHSENWFFYSYYNLKFRRYEVTSIELFEGDTQFNSTHFSSLNDIKPSVYTKSYIIPRPFDSMQLTLTERGISAKDIIVACKSGLLVEIPWFLIDSRRPLKVTEVEREENLIPYMPEIPLNFEFSLNYYNFVYNIRGIATAPTGLESTSLVFAYGLDSFFTRVFPSKTFDMLREDFDYFFITTLMVGLVLGTLLSKKLASASNLKKAWK